MKLVRFFSNGLRIGIAFLCLWYISMFLVNIPVFYDRLANDCITTECLAAPSPPPGRESLYEMGLNEHLYALFYTVLDCIFIFSYVIAAIIVFLKRGQDLMGMLGALVLVTFGITFPSIMTVSAEHNQTLLIINNVMTFIGWTSLCIFFLLFPTGRFAPKWMVWMLIPFGIFFILGFFENVPMIITFLRLLFVFCLLMFSQIYRYRNVSTQIQRQQTKWVVYGFIVAISGFLALVFIPLLFNPNIFQEGSTLFFFIFNTTVYLFLLLIPVTLTFALLRRRLWDIDPLLNRTLVYAIMSVIVIMIYVVIVWYLSNMFKTNDNLIISIIATSVVAVSFSPIKEKVQQYIVRKMYGEQGNPFFVLALLGKKIQESRSPEQVLDQIVRTIREVLRLPYASIQLLQDKDNVILTQYGESPEEVHHLPITYRGTKLGYLIVAPRSPGEAFTSSDERLWEVLIQQLGPLLQDLKATIDLKTLNQDLQVSRERLVLAREEERHYLRRNLHDDLAPRLAALAYTAAAAEDLVDTDPYTVKTLLAEHQKMILGTVDDIRRLVYDLRPPTIDEYGIIEALRLRVEEIITSIKKSKGRDEEKEIQFIFNAPTFLPTLPAAVEVAIYRIISESVVNVVRHSGATNCSVSIIVNNNKLELEIIDNGIGYTKKQRVSTMGGLGVQSMTERAEELGGKLTIEHRTEGGTRVAALVPLLING